jgi:DNA-binding Lrp family transcriptional regulator
MTELEKKIIIELQQDMPLVPRPYAVIASRLEITEGELLRQIEAMRGKGVIRKMGAVLRHRRIGIKANALCVWQVPEERVEAVGELFAALPEVTHCYERETRSDWPYNLYTMVHAATREQCEEHLKAMYRMSRIANYRVFFSTQELKKTTMQYFR